MAENGARVSATLLWRTLAVAFALQVLFLSGEPGNSDRSASLLWRLLDFFSIHVDDHFFRMAHNLTRKSLHLLQYAIFSGLLYLSLLPEGHLDWDPRVARWALLGAIGLAIVDEFHQSTAMGRTGSLRDVALDGTGAALGLTMIYWVTRQYRSWETRKQEGS